MAVKRWGVCGEMLGYRQCWGVCGENGVRVTPQSCMLRGAGAAVAAPDEGAGPRREEECGERCFQLEPEELLGRKGCRGGET